MRVLQYGLVNSDNEYGYGSKRHNRVRKQEMVYMLSDRVIQVWKGGFGVQQWLEA